MQIKYIDAQDNFRRPHSLACAILYHLLFFMDSLSQHSGQAALGVI